MKKETIFLRGVHEFRKAMHIQLLSFELYMHYAYINGDNSLDQTFNSSFDMKVFTKKELKIILKEAQKVLQLKYGLKVECEKPLIISKTS